MTSQQAEIELSKAQREYAEALAFESGVRAGTTDFRIGRFSRYLWFVEQNPGIAQSMSLGYRAGWLAAERARREGR